jgi:hypothetical protein
VRQRGFLRLAVHHEVDVSASFAHQEPVGVPGHDADRDGFVPGARERGGRERSRAAGAQEMNRGEVGDIQAAGGVLAEGGEVRKGLPCGRVVWGGGVQRQRKDLAIEEVRVQRPSNKARQGTVSDDVSTGHGGPARRGVVEQRLHVRRRGGRARRMTWVQRRAGLLPLSARPAEVRAPRRRSPDPVDLLPAPAAHVPDQQIARLAIEGEAEWVP